MDSFSFKPVGTEDPNAPIAEAVPAVPLDAAAEDEAENPSSTAIMVGCGLLGWVVAGPFLALLTALGGAYAAERNKGPFGESSKAMGRVAAAAGKKATDEHLFCKMKAAVRSIFKQKNCNCENCNKQGCSASK